MYRIDMSCDADRALKYLDGMAARSRDFSSVFRWAREELKKANAANFAANGLPVGGWSPLKPRYAAWKARNFPGAPMMVQNGKLRRSLTDLRGNPNRIDKMEAEFGTSVESVWNFTNAKTPNCF
jgi:phage gpG-like protein